MTAVGALLGRKPVWFTLLLVSGFVLYRIWIALDAAQKLRAYGAEAADAPSDVAVVMTVDPEQFHMVALQQAGRMVRLEGRTAFLKDVPPSMVRALARRYWIRELSHWSEGEDGV